MKLYERYFKSGYEELITYYPRYYREFFEMVELLKALGRISVEMEDNIERAYLNNFILTADAETIKIWEGLLNITYTAKLTLDQRKRVVIARIMGYGHIGEPEIRGIIANYTDTAVAVDFAGGVISITIDGEIFDETNLMNTLLQRIPAHLALDVKAHIRREFRQQLEVYFAGAVGSHITASPLNSPRESRKAIYAGYSGFLAPRVSGVPLGAETASSRRADGAGGVFCYTHIKSKLIE